MSQYVGAHTHASPRARRTSRAAAQVAAAGLSLLLVAGYGVAARADEPSDAVDGRAGTVGVAGLGGTADAGSADLPESGGRTTRAGGAIEISATSSDTDLVTFVTTGDEEPAGPETARPGAGASSTGLTAAVGEPPGGG